MKIGTLLGSPISLILAATVLDYLLDNFLYSFINMKMNLFCSWYTKYMRNFNSFNINIQLTVEQENNCSVPFLDTKVIKTTNNTIILDWKKLKI